ncbi:hypothetical protein LEMLEM_LOCUS26001 [Lemmus lemmus]
MQDSGILVTTAGTTGSPSLSAAGVTALGIRPYQKPQLLKGVVERERKPGAPHWGLSLYQGGIPGRGRGAAGEPGPAPTPLMNMMNMNEATWGRKREGTPALLALPTPREPCC